MICIPVVSYNCKNKMASPVSSSDKQRGNECMKDRDFTGAASFYRVALQGGPDIAEKAVLHHNLGRAYLGLGEPENAMKEFNLSIDLNPQYGKAYFGRAQAFSALATPDLVASLSAYQHAKLHTTLEKDLIGIDSKIAALQQQLAGISKAAVAAKVTAPAVAAADSARSTGVDVSSPRDDQLADVYPDYEADPAWQRFDVGRLFCVADMKGMESGDAWWVVPGGWWKGWCAYTGFDEGTDAAAWARIFRARGGAASPRVLDVSPADPVVAREWNAGHMKLPGTLKGDEEASVAGAVNAPQRPGKINSLELLAAPDAWQPSSSSSSSSSSSTSNPPSDGGSSNNGSGAEDPATPLSPSDSEGLNGPRLRAGLQYGEDYVLIPAEAGKLVSSLYGVDGPRIVRYCVPNGIKGANGKSEQTVDIYPELKRYDKFGLMDLALPGAGAGAEDIGGSSGSYEMLNDGGGDNDEEMSDGEQQQHQHDGGRVSQSSAASANAAACNNCKKLGAVHRCAGCKQVHYCTAECQRADWNEHKTVCAAVKLAIVDPSKLNGRVGLVNLGNTCFMNSSLQALSACWPLTQYFLSGKYKDEINTTNKLGLGGRLATAYADLLDDLWRHTRSSVAPTDVKRAVSKFQERFSGFAQHDAQELLQYFLDGVHEDLNRVKVKEYVEDEESNGRPDEVVAPLSWEKYQRRNRSVIVDHFAGQLKSTLVCPDCKKVSVKFDPYNMIQLPIAKEQAAASGKRFIEVFLQRLLYDPSDARVWASTAAAQGGVWSSPRSGAADYRSENRLERYILQINQGASFAQVAEALSAECGIAADCLAFEKVDKHSLEMVDIMMGTNTTRETWVPDPSRPSKFEAAVMAVETAPPDWHQPGGNSPAVAAGEQQPQQQLDGKEFLAKLPSSHRVLMLLDARGFKGARATGFFGGTSADNIGRNSIYNDAARGTDSIPPSIISCSKDTTIAQLRMIIARQMFPFLGPKAKAILQKQQAGDAQPSDEEVHRYIASQLLLSTHPGVCKPVSLKWLPTIKPDGSDDVEANGGPDAPQATTTRIGDAAFNFPVNILVENKREHRDFLWTKAVVMFRGPLADCFDYKAAVASKDTACAERAMEVIKSKVHAGINLMSCFENFRQTEILDSDNAWRCPGCKKEVCASKTMEIWSLPDLLFVHLKRFRFVVVWIARWVIVPHFRRASICASALPATSAAHSFVHPSSLPSHLLCSHRGYRSDKVSDLVSFPLTALDLSQYHLQAQRAAAAAADASSASAGAALPSTLYDCIAVVNHFGSAYGGCHCDAWSA